MTALVSSLLASFRSGFPTTPVFGKAPFTVARKALVPALFCLLAAASCDFPQGAGEEKSSLTITLPGGAAQARDLRAAQPQPVHLPEAITDLLSYRLDFFSSGANFSIGPTQEKTITVELAPGKWNIVVSAWYNTEVVAKAIAEEVDILGGQENSVTFTMDANDSITPNMSGGANQDKYLGTLNSPVSLAVTVETGTVFTGLGGWTDSFEYKWYYEDSEGNPTDIGAPVTFSGPGTKSFSCPVNNATPGTFDYYIEIINTYTYTPAGGAPVSRRAAKHIHVANVVVVTGTTYAVGETGPGGGTIFYVNPDGFTSNGVLCHYLEAGWLYLVSPATMQWSTSGTSVGAGAGGTAVGTGYANTQAILAALSGEPGMAAHRADAYAEGGQSDWFLPSRGELEAYYKEIHGSTNRLLWSSTESDSGRAWAVTYDNESQRVQSTTTAKTESLWVLPIRAF